MPLYNWRLTETYIENRLPISALLPKSTIRGRKAAHRLRFRALVLSELERFHPAAVKAATAKVLAALHIEGRENL